MANNQADIHGSPEIALSNFKINEDAKQHDAEEIEVSKGNVPQMRLKSDDLGIWESVGRYKLISAVAMAAAFSASLDGYRKSIHPQTSWSVSHYTNFKDRDQSQWRYCIKQGIYQTNGELRYENYQWKIRLCLGRDSICWSDDRPSRMSLTLFSSSVCCNLF